MIDTSRSEGMSYPISHIPEWCGMEYEDHNDYMGGCWGLAIANLSSYPDNIFIGEEYCKECQHYEGGDQDENQCVQ